MAVRLLVGRILAVESSAINDFLSMAVGPCTTLTGETEIGDCELNDARFLPRQ
jgi:hypothetical protein